MGQFVRPRHLKSGGFRILEALRRLKKVIVVDSWIFLDTVKISFLVERDEQELL